MSAELASGTELGTYRVESLVGRGAMGAVYVATDLRLERRVALKVLAPDVARDERFRERFLRESRLAASLEHPHIVPIYSAGEADDLLFLAMRYVEGRDLRDLIRRVGRLEPARAVALLGQIADALDAAHGLGLVHRDVKPANVLIAAGRGGAEHAYLCDFGLAKHASTVSSLTSERSLVGTIDYVAPEQIEGGAVDGRADVYGLGCVLYECLAGAPPFARGMELAVVYAHLNDPPPRLSERRPELPEALDDVIACALAKDPAARYATCGELAAAAAAALAGSVPDAPRAVAGRALVRTFLIADVRGYTTYTREHGDAAAAALAASFAELASLVVARHGGTLVEIRGDEALAVFESAREALTAAVALQHEAVTGGLARGIGVGIDAGEAVAVGEGYRGAALNLAARLCGLASAGQVLASDQARHLAGRVEGIRYRQRRPVRVKGIAEPVRIVEVLAEQPIVQPPAAAGRGRGRPLLAAAALLLLAAAGVAALVQRSSAGHKLAAAAAGGGASDAVVVVDARSERVIGRIPLGTGSEPRDIAIGGDNVWVANTGNDTVTHIDARTHTIVRTIGGTTVQALTADGHAAWVVTRPDTVRKTWSLVQLDAATDAPVATIPLPFTADADPSDDDIAIGGNAVWLTAGIGRLLRAAIDGSAHVASVGSRAFAFAGPVAYADGGAWAAGVTLPAGLLDLAVRVTQQGSGLAAVPRVRVAPGAPTGGHLVDAIAADAHTVWLVTRDTLWRLDPAQRVVTRTISLGPGDWTGIALGGDAVWLTDSRSGTLLRVDMANYAIKGIHVGDGAIRVAVGAGAVWVTVQSAGVPTAGNAAASAASTPGKGGALRLLATDDYDYWDGTSYNGDVWSLEFVTCNALLDYPSSRDPQVQRRLIPGVAAALPTISADGRTYAFTVRRGLHFSDGRRLTAQDVKATFDRLLDRNARFDALASTSYYNDIVGFDAYQHGARTISGISVRGDTVAFRLEKPDPAFAYAVAIRWACIVPKDSPHAHTRLPPPTTGPYKFASYTPNRSVVLVRNPYWAANARILGRDTHGLDNVDRITITIGASPDRQLQLIAQGEADLSLDQSAASGPQLTRVERSATLRRLLVAAPKSALQFVWFNTSILPFSNVLLRRAVNYAIDRRELTAVVGGDSIAPTSQLMSSPLLAPGAAPDVYPQTADLAAARRLVRESGVKIPIPVSYWYPSGLDANGAVAQALEARLDAAGFRVTLRPVDPNFYYPTIQEPRYRVSMGWEGWAPDFPDAVDFFEPLLKGSRGAPGTGANYGHFEVPAVDRQIDRIAAMPLDDARIRAWTQLSEDVAREDAPWAPYADVRYQTIGSPRVRNLIVNSVKGGVDYELISLH